MSKIFFVNSHYSGWDIPENVYNLEPGLNELLGFVKLKIKRGGKETDVGKNMFAFLN